MSHKSLQQGTFHFSQLPTALFLPPTWAWPLALLLASRLWYGIAAGERGVSLERAESLERERALAWCTAPSSTIRT
jgi:hypothetical protein